jgi:hypothetical protein
VWSQHLPVFIVARFEQLFIDIVVPLGQLKLGGEILLRLLLLQGPLLLYMRPHDGVEVAVGLGASGHGGWRGAIELPRRFLYRLCNGFCALDVSLTLLPQQLSIRLAIPYAGRMQLTLGCLSSETRRLCLLLLSGAFAVRGTNALYQESPSYMVADAKFVVVVFSLETPRFSELSMELPHGTCSARPNRAY